MTHPKQRYIGTKMLLAVAMTRGDYVELRGWKLPENENGADEGYLVEYLDGGPANLPGYAGYVSWSPKDVFERAYRPIVTAWDGDNLEEVEALIRAGGADAPRVTPEKLRGLISEVRFIQPTGTLMICIVTLKNGFTVTGESACVSPENFRENIGRRVSYSNALDKLWPLEGYRMKEDAYRAVVSLVGEQQPPPNPEGSLGSGLEAPAAG